MAWFRISQYRFGNNIAVSVQCGSLVRGEGPASLRPHDCHRVTGRVSDAIGVVSEWHIGDAVMAACKIDEGHSSRWAARDDHQIACRIVELPASANSFLWYHDRVKQVQSAGPFQFCFVRRCVLCFRRRQLRCFYLTPVSALDSWQDAPWDISRDTANFPTPPSVVKSAAFWSVTKAACRISF